MLQDISTWGIPITLLFVVAGFVWSACIWLTNQFSKMKKTIFDRIDSLETTILNKIQYHERHDDSRFHDMQNDIWAIKIRNAAIDGITRAQVKNSKPVE